jgi:sulfopyruvate decarboxylase subunit alpha
MPAETSRSEAVVEALERLDLAYTAYVPSNTIAPIIEGYRQRAGERRVFAVSREEEAVGIIGAVALAGRMGAIIMQDNGFGNALTALTTFAVAYHLPLLIVANTRGGLGEYNSMIHAISEPVPEILAAARIPTFRLGRLNPAADWGATVHEAGRHAAMTHRPVVVLMEFWDPASGAARA